MGRPATDKRDRLIDAAVTRFHRHGAAGSSLALVAADAGIATGNVYYYFRTRDALSTAVIDRWCERVEQHLESHDAADSPIDRIRSFLTHSKERRQGYADFGCPLAALRADFRVASPPMATASGRPLALLCDWLIRQFKLAGEPTDTALRYAEFVLATLQGSYALAHATSDPTLIERAVEELSHWLDRL
ncbi:MAG: TetR/AcrR family transcriptional regulator [Pseudomonadota bacterium]